MCKRTVRGLELAVLTFCVDYERILKGIEMTIQSLKRTALRIQEGIDRRRAIRELVRMQDWRLADLGIERGRIPEIVDGLIARRVATQAASQAALPPATSAGGLPGAPISQVPA